MLVHKNGDSEDILGFICDMCTTFTSMDVIPNEHGEFRYICPKCGHKMKETLETETNEEETKMVNAYTVSNAAKRLNCCASTVVRAIQDGRFHDCFMETGYHGRPAWMIPSDQVEEWVSKGGFLQTTSPKSKFMSRSQVRAALEKAKEEAASKQKKANVTGETIAKRDASGKPIAGRYPWDKDENVRKVFDPEIGKDVPVLDLLSEEDRKPVPEPAPARPMNEFEKRAVRRVAGQKYVKVLDRTTKEKMEEIKMENVRNKEILKNFAEETPFLPVNPGPVVRTDNGFAITFPAELINDMVQKQLKGEIAGRLAQLRAAFDQMNEELKKLEEVIA